MISSGQTFTNILNLSCGLDLEHSDSIFAQDTPAYNFVLLMHVWLQTDQQFRKYSRNSLFFFLNYISPKSDLDNEESETIFLCDTLAHDAA